MSYTPVMLTKEPVYTRLATGDPWTILSANPVTQEGKALSAGDLCVRYFGNGAYAFKVNKVVESVDNNNRKSYAYMCVFSGKQ
jgi:hypothetical protein